MGIKFKMFYNIIEMKKEPIMCLNDDKSLMTEGFLFFQFILHPYVFYSCNADIYFCLIHVSILCWVYWCRLYSILGLCTIGDYRRKYKSANHMTVGGGGQFYLISQLTCFHLYSILAWKPSPTLPRLLPLFTRAWS